MAAITGHKGEPMPKKTVLRLCLIRSGSQPSLFPLSLTVIALFPGPS